ncbi:protein Lines homolog 1 [Osmerus eperlanus]|uniref:protein Lines homolog 1 n=1 Tax=Osmerus eperlanus TaxID=29151 RepID=UPI002E0DB32A
MNSILLSLNDAYRSLLIGASPNITAQEFASTMSLCVRKPQKQCCESVPVPDRDAECSDQPREPFKSPECYDNGVDEIPCIALTLMEKIFFKMTCQSWSQETLHYFSTVYRILLQEFGIMSNLIDIFQTKDLLTSHLAAKCASACVSVELRSSENLPVNPIWERKCLQVFLNPSPGPELDGCLWSLQDVIKTLLKQPQGHSGALQKLLASFDPALSSLCSKLLPGSDVDQTDSALYSSSTANRGATLCTLLDLLEVLTASRVRSGSRGCFLSQRLAHTQAPGLLRIVMRPLDYFVKKRVMLLLKRVLLEKAGEDMALANVPAPTDRHICSDMNALTSEVLQAVHAGWLQGVPVESGSVFFSGTRQACDGGSDRPDYVMLRAVSLVLLKSLDYKIKSGSGTGVDPTMDVPGCLQGLLLFLNQRGVQLHQPCHPCTWVSVVFGEQDDDMMETAKALLSLHLLHNRVSSEMGVFAGASNTASCSTGCNPHCHFLSLLRSVSFDHSILLDFLISTETCFLEYLVRYLKHLQGDRESFSEACQKMEALDWTQRLDSLGEDLHRSSLAPCSSVSPLGLVLPSPVPPLRLVDYGSSDESETEVMDVSDTPRRATGLEACISESRPRLGGLNLSQGDKREPSSSLGRTQEGPQLSSSTEGFQTTLDCKKTTGRGSQPRTDPDCGQGRSLPGPGWRLRTLAPAQDRRHGDLDRRAFTCLSELRDVIARLQKRNLFPYNPTSLLKLLTKIETESVFHH